MRVRFAACIVALALAMGALLGPPGAASADDESATSRPKAQSALGERVARDGDPGARKARVIFVKNKKHLKRLNKYIKRKRRKLPRCTRAVHVWRGARATYSCCAKCKVNAPNQKTLRTLQRRSASTAPRGWCITHGH